MKFRASLTEDLTSLDEYKNLSQAELPTGQQLLAYRDGALSKAETEQLKDRLAMDPEVASIYLELLHSEDLNSKALQIQDSNFSEAEVAEAWKSFLVSTGIDPGQNELATDGQPSETRVVMSRVLRPNEVDDGSFDLEFWRRVGAEGRFAAAWEMVGEVSAIRGEDGHQPRLQRSVVRVIRP